MQALLLVFFLLGFLLPSVDSIISTIGNQSVLVVAVKSPNGTFFTKEQISERVFGNPANQKPGWPDLTSIYKTCSYEKLNIIKAEDRKPTNTSALPDGNSAEEIVNGSTTVTITSMDDWENKIVKTLTVMFGVDDRKKLADHIVFCFPPGVGDASTASDGMVRMTHDRCIDPFVLAHEFGHSIGLWHSREINSKELNIGGYNPDEYGDESCMMGHAFGKNDYLQKAFEEGTNISEPMPVCFNGAKTWQLGWFEDQHHTFKAAENKWEGKLIGQVDYRKSDGTKFKIILKLEARGPTQNEDFYVMFHHVTRPFTTEYNYDNPNTVTIVRSNNDPWSPSHLVKVLRTSEFHLEENFNGTGEQLKLTVKSINLSSDPAFADIVVEMLGQNTAVPTSATPTTQPTSGQPTTTRPTVKPTTTTTQPTTGQLTTTSPTAKTTAAPTPTTDKPTATPTKAGKSTVHKMKESKAGKSKAHKTKSKVGKGSIDENI